MSVAVPQSAAPPSIPQRVAARVIDFLVVSAVGAGLGVALGFGFAWLLIG
jgi:hypothetical protein